MRKYVIALLVYGGTGVGCYFWLRGSTGAANVMQFWYWAITAAGLCTAWKAIDAPLPKAPMSRAVLGAAYQLASLAVIVWLGHQVLAACYMFVSLALIGLRSKS